MSSTLYNLWRTVFDVKNEIGRIRKRHAKRIKAEVKKAYEAGRYDGASSMPNNNSFKDYFKQAYGAPQKPKK